MYYDPFVLPFTIGLNILLIYLVIKYARWIRTFSPEDKRTIRRNLFSLKTLKAGKEVFLESLVHHKIFRTNPFLGYMHMCFGLGWFLLIVVGKIESLVYHTSIFNPPYFAIFFRYFHPAQETFPYSSTFAFLMDLILLMILSGFSETNVFQSTWFEKNNQSSSFRLTHPHGIVVNIPSSLSG